MTKTADPILEIEHHAATIAAGAHETVRPGMPFRITEAASPGDAVWQGDLAIEVVADDEMPLNYAEVERPTDADRQLVPGNTRGAKHCLDSLSGVRVFRPKSWPNVTRTGPLLRLSEERTILHPVHGPVTVPAGMSVLCSYQREWDAEQRAERRNAD